MPTKLYPYSVDSKSGERGDPVVQAFEKAVFELNFWHVSTTAAQVVKSLTHSIRLNYWFKILKTWAARVYRTKILTLKSLVEAFDRVAQI